MTMLGDVVKVKKSRKPHACWWCGDEIEKGSSYVKWCWNSYDNLDTVKVHPECREAWSSLPYGENEVHFAEFKRGSTEEN
jgi:hypothetical protein